MFRKIIFFMCFYSVLISAKLPENNEVKRDGPVKVTVRPRYSIVRTGSWVKMECLFEPKGAYIVTWWKSEDGMIKPIGKKSELQLWNVTKKDEGWYTCSVSRIATLGCSSGYLRVIE